MPQVGEAAANHHTELAHLRCKENGAALGARDGRRGEDMHLLQQIGIIGMAVCRDKKISALATLWAQNLSVLGPLVLH